MQHFEQSGDAANFDISPVKSQQMIMFSIISEQFDFSSLFTTCSDENLLLQFLVYAPLGGISGCLWHPDPHTCHCRSFQMYFSRKFLIHRATSRLQLPS